MVPNILFEKGNKSTKNYFEVDEFSFKSYYVERILNRITKHIDKPTHDEKACIRGSEFILHEILD